jgi:SAM-dependent methyltransferase
LALLQTARPVEVEARDGRPESPRTAEAREWSGWFERIYREASGDAGKVPWAHLRPNAAMVAWMNSQAPGVVRPGACVTVVGCGLGDDVRELADRGYDVTGFDVSPTAIDWARRRHRDLADRFVVADLLSLPAGLKRRADLVVEVSTVQAVHPELRPAIVSGIGALARPRGVVLAVCRGRGDGEPIEAVEGPPYALTCGELAGLFAREGFVPVSGVDDFEDDETPPVRRLRAALRRA